MSDIFKQEDAEVQKTDVSVYIDAIDNDAAFRIIDLSEKMHTVPKTKKEKDLAAMGHPKDKITHKDVLIGRGVLSKEEEDRIAEKANTLGLDEGSKHAARPRSASRPGTEPAKKGNLQDRIMAARQRMDAKKKDMKEESEQIDELKKSTLKSYTQKANAEVSDIKKKQAE
jgi:hypothetical protein